MSFVDFIGEPPTTTVTINGHAIIVSRARFGLHLQLARLNEHIANAVQTRNRQMVAALISEYLLMCGVQPDDIENGCGDEVIFAWLQIKNLNTLREKPAILRQNEPHTENNTAEKPPYEYDGRYWAWIISTLASSYGWSETDILNLSPEAAIYYLQEALIIDYRNIEIRRQLSKIAYQYDEHSKTFTYHPLPKPGWMSDTTQATKKVRVRKSLLPVGTITKLDGSEVEYVQ